MLEAGHINDIAQQVIDALPPGLSALPRDMQKNIRQILQAAFDKMDLVTREEFEVQQKVLARTREKLERLERRIQEIENASE